MMDKRGKTDPSEDGDIQPVRDPVWLFVALVVVVAIGLWLANSPDMEALIATLAPGAPR